MLANLGNSNRINQSLVNEFFNPDTIERNPPGNRSLGKIFSQAEFPKATDTIPEKFVLIGADLFCFFSLFGFCLCTLWYGLRVKN